MRVIFPYLALAGAIPFVACSLLLLMGYQDMPFLSNAQGQPINITTILSVYGMVIASFMAGSHWGTHLHLAKSDQWVTKLPAISNIIALGLWLGFLIQPMRDVLILLLLSFSIMLVVDMHLQRANIITKAYFTIRCLVTAIVNISLIAAIIHI